MLAGLKSVQRWLYPGLGLKRWLATLLLGLILLGLGLSLLLQGFNAYFAWLPLPMGVAVLAGTAGISLALLSIYQINKLLLGAFLPQQATVTEVVEQVYRYRQQKRPGPTIVAIGGGTGLSTLLRGLKYHTKNVIAIVTVADDGGSSGKLRRELGVLPPGDFRNCIAALANDEALITQLFQYRFRSGQGLEGHSFGNLFITAMAEVTGSFENALYESGRVLKIQGNILPSTLEDVTLFAEVCEGHQLRKVKGESAIPVARLPIERVYLQPDEPKAFPPALQAILSADLIIMGPGSLYTSVIPNLLVKEITSAIRASTAPKIYICNVATQPGETDGYSLGDHIRAIETHTNLVAGHLPSPNAAGPGQARPAALFDFVLVNNNLGFTIPADMNLQPIEPTSAVDNRYTLISADVVDEQAPWRHDSKKLAHELMAWYKTTVASATNNQ